MPDSAGLLERLGSGPALLLDGPTGTELQRRGFETGIPGWTASAIEAAPSLLEQIHRDYVMAGAEVLTANTFRTHVRNLAPLGLASRAAELTQRAVEIARRAATGAERPVWIAGSQAPVGDCYDPGLSSSSEALEREHVELSANLAAAGVDLILVETHPTLVEGLAAARAALSTGLPVIMSFVCSRSGRLLSGEPLDEAARQAARLPVAAVAVNCILADIAVESVRALRRACGQLPVGVYANVGFLAEDGSWRNSESIEPGCYLRHASDWLDAGARLIGGCCGTTPAHIRELRRLIDGRRADAPGG